MPNKPLLVINTSPLVALAAALKNLSVIDEVATLVVPGEVMTELKAGSGRDETARLVEAAAGCSVRSLFTGLPLALSSALGAGEAAVIHTALTEGIATVVIDERKGRRVAALHGLRVTGSLGILLALHRRGLVPSMPAAIDRVKAKGIHLDDALVREALELAVNDR